MNRENLRRVRDRIAAEPEERLDMCFETTSGGTSHCIGEWANVLRGAERGLLSSNGEGNSAADWLGLTELQTSRLFFPPWMTGLTKSDALAALDSLIEAEDDDAMPVWPVKEGV